MIRRFLKLFFKLFVLISVFECIYLFVLPPVLQKMTDKDFLFSLLEKNTNIALSVEKFNIKTHIKPSVSLSAENIKIKNKLSNEHIISSDTIDIELSLFPLFFKKIAPSKFYADNLQISAVQNEEGIFNFENLFEKKNESNIKTEFKNFHIKTNGTFNINNSKSDFETDMTCSINPKHFSQNLFEGSIFLYNLNLKEFLPLFQKFMPEIKSTDGIIDFIQISGESQNNQSNQITINTKFNNLLYDMKGWENFIYASGENKISSTINLFEDKIQVNHFKYKADNVDISTDGTIELKTHNGIITDLNVGVNKSKAENIVSLLPPTLVKETMIIEKIKNYGVYGDIDGRVNIKGKLPQPDITGWVKGRNVKILDKNIQKLHKGTVDINFDKRKLNMNILIEMPNKQKAQIEGTTYMFRDGVNDVIVKTTPNLDFSLAHKLIIPISKVFSFQLGPLADMNITSGNGIIDMHVKGSLDFIDLGGYSEFDNANLTYNGIFGNITKGKGRLDFKKDVISVKTQRAFIEDNPFSVEGSVKINDNLNFNVNSLSSRTEDLLKIVNKSEFLKDIKKGLVLFKEAKGQSELFFNISADIVPVPFGKPPLPFEEAFKNIKVNGFVTFNDVKCFLEGFKIPVENIKGRVNFTETVVDFKDLTAISGSSPVSLEGKIITDIKTKIPDIDLTISSNSIKSGDTIRFLSNSYLYPKNYPDISFLYNLDTKHDLYFKYKAKSVDFLTDKVYAIMKVIPDINNDICAKSGKIIMDKAVVTLDNINMDILNSNINISGSVKKVDTVNPVYDIQISSDKINLENIEKLDKIEIVSQNIKDIVKHFSDYKGFMDFSLKYKNNIFKTTANFKDFSLKQNGIPIKFDDFTVNIKDDKLSAGNVTLDLAGMPVFADFNVSDIYNAPYIEGYITTKLTNDFIKNYFPPVISNKIEISGDINISSSISGTKENLKVKPQITMHKDADTFLSGVSLGDRAEKRIIKSEIDITKNKTDIKNIEYYKYIASQNGSVYPVLFANGSILFRKDEEKEIFEPVSAYIKTEKNLSAKLLNAILNKPLFNQGVFTCDLKYDGNKLEGEIEARNIDIPIVDTVIKNIKLNTDNDNIKVRFFSFVNDSVVRTEALFDNNLKKPPRITSINIKADKIFVDKLLNSVENARKFFSTQKKEDNNISNLLIFQIENGKLQIDELNVKNYTANNIESNFLIDKDGNFKMYGINVKLGEGNASGEILYDLKNTDITAELNLKNVDSNYIAENLLDAKNQIYGMGNAYFYVKTNGNSEEELIKNLSGFAYFDMADGRMPKLGSLEYLLRASNIIKGGVTGFTINNVLEILNLVKTGYFSNINGSFNIKDGTAKDIEIFSQGENLSLYLHGDYNISSANADMEILGKLSNRISTIFGPIGNTSLNTFFRYIPGISLLDFSRKDFIENVEKIPAFTSGNYESRTFQAIIKGDINSSGYVQSFKWVKTDN